MRPFCEPAGLIWSGYAFHQSLVYSLDWVLEVALSELYCQRQGEGVRISQSGRSRNVHLDLA